MRLPTAIAYEGTDLSLWTHSQLERLGKDALRTRALTLRDAIGVDRLSPLPRHEDGMIRWILDVQSSLTQLSGTPYSVHDFGLPSDTDRGSSGSGRLSVADDSSTLSETSQHSIKVKDYREAKLARNVAKDRGLRGSGDIF